MAAKKKSSAERAEGKLTKSDYIRQFPGLSPRELSERAAKDGYDIPPKIVSITRSQDKRKAGATPAGAAKSRPAPRKSAPRQPGSSVSGGSSLAELLSNADEVSAAKQAVSDEIKALEARIASLHKTLKILSAAG
jgi:hypothetical protein